ncbi:SDR family oxidoreductase [Pseudonocardia sp. GCM10023141]|uniref:SDR family oxidoreductase n=1 Tax=Pseudonocardia sp. GCM10023141 TaxID=3252653 RepID=UPI00360D76D8
MDLGLQGRRALVMGSSRGLGYSVAAALAAEGTGVFLNARGSEELEKRAAHLGAAGFHAASVEDPDAGEQTVAAAVAALGGLDILVTNTGAPTHGGFADVDQDAWEHASHLTLMSVVRLVRAALPHLRASDQARIIMITSVGVREPIPDEVLHNAFQAAVTATAKALVREVAGDGITVNTVQSGYIRTERNEAIHRAEAQRSGRSFDDVTASAAAFLPMKRLGNALGEFGPLCTFLCSRQAGYVTGQSIAIDGGLLHSLL